MFVGVFRLFYSLCELGFKFVDQPLRLCVCTSPISRFLLSLPLGIPAAESGPCPRIRRPWSGFCWWPPLARAPQALLGSRALWSPGGYKHINTFFKKWLSPIPSSVTKRNQQLESGSFWSRGDISLELSQVKALT